MSFLFWWLALVLPQRLHPGKGVLVNDRFMSIPEDLPLFRWSIDLLLAFVGELLRLEVDRMSEILLLFQNAGDRGRNPRIWILQRFHWVATPLP